MENQETRNRRKQFVGIVVSNFMQGTAVVAIVNNIRHPIYKKIVKKTVKFFVDDPKNECSIGDKVVIAETRPLSKNKHFRLVKILEKAK